MNARAPAAVTACYADFRLVRTRKVCQVICELPIEHAASFIAAFGIPDPSAEIPVAIARLQEPSEKPQEAKERKRLSELRPSAQAALIGSRPDFWAFLREEVDHGSDCTSEEEAAVFVRHWCGVGSRSMLDNDPKSAAVWGRLRDRYTAWQIAGG